MTVRSERREKGIANKCGQKNVREKGWVKEGSESNGHSFVPSHSAAVPLMWIDVRWRGRRGECGHFGFENDPNSATVR